MAWRPTQEEIKALSEDSGQGVLTCKKILEKEYLLNDIANLYAYIGEHEFDSHVVEILNRIVRRIP